MSVPACLDGPEFFAYRARQRQVDAVKTRQQSELDREHARFRAILADPNTTAQEKHWARLALGIDDTERIV